MMNLYALQDIKVGKFYPPVCYESDFTAMRSIQDVIKYASESMISRHPDDFKLFKLATFNDETGIVVSLIVPELITECINLVDKE